MAGTGWRSHAARWVAAAACAGAASAASAALLQLDATTLAPNSFSDFSLTFDDANGDEIFQFGELASFSGVSVVFLSASLSTLLQVPTIAGISELGGSCQDSDSWCVGGGGGILVTSPGNWSYRISPVQAIPEPGTLALAGLALVATANRRRRSAGVQG